MTHLLDTDVCIDVLRQRPGVVTRLREIPPNGWAISMITVYELYCGLAKAQDPERERQKIQRFVSAIIELPFERAAAEASSEIRASLERQGMVIGPYDLLIAGQAMALGLTLVSKNIREFARVEGLMLESWA